MSFPSFGRLASLYHRRMLKLFHGRLFELIRDPALVGDPEFQRAAWQIARGMVQGVATANARSWREAAMKSTRARQVYNALRAEIERTNIGPELDQIARRNAELIASVPADIAERITARAAALQLRGARAVEVEREIRKWAPELAASRMKLIARTEISKAETSLTVVRSESIGIAWGQWLTSEDQRVRPSHRNLDRVLMRWDDPPQPEALIGQKSSLGPGLAGSFPNCRCLMAPLISPDEVKWPAKVYRLGKIVRMSKVEFTRSTGVKIAA